MIQKLINNFIFLARGIVDFIYPNNCQLCQTSLTHKENYFCLNCYYDLPFLNRHNLMQESIQKIFWGRVNVEYVYSLLNFQKGNDTQKLLHAIKYNDKTKMAIHLGEVLGQEIKENKNIDFIIPVPLHPKRERERGYNQSYFISKGIQNETNIPILNTAVKRNKKTKSQTKFSKYDRWDNVEAIFTLNKPEIIRNKTILIVDDILTTGATLESISNVCIKKSNCKVYIATLACRI